jgi:Clr5 domain
MIDESNSHEGQGSSTCALFKLSIKTRNDLKWDVHKDEIYQIYVEQNNTLRETMQAIEGKHRFKARRVNFHLRVPQINHDDNCCLQ